MRVAPLLASLALGASAIAAQDAPAPRPADVSSIDGIIAALYESISGPAGAPRDWPRLRSLVTPDARLMPTGRRPDGTGVRRSWSVEEYITTVGPQLERGGFFEREIGHRTDRFGNIVQRFSSYESRRAANDPQPFARGINSIQLWHDGSRWWILTILWEAESPGVPIPAEYLSPGG
jgi:hypothetical protein